MELIYLCLYSGHYKDNKLIKYFQYEASCDKWFQSLFVHDIEVSLLSDYYSLREIDFCFVVVRL